MIEDIEGTPEISPAQAHDVVKGLTLLTKYFSHDLYRRYQAQCFQAGRQPASQAALGRMLRRIGCDPRKKGTGNGTRAAWLVTLTSQREEWADGRWT